MTVPLNKSIFLITSATFMTSADLLMTVPQYNLGDAHQSLTFDLQVSSKIFIKCPGT